MILSPLIGLLLASLARSVHSQDIKYDEEHNATSIVGTWSSGSKAVVTGAGFANPANMSFNYPRTTGISFSFDDDGNYEVARYRMNGNGSEPTCVTGVIGWAHGKYSLNGNGSITLTPFGDGFQQIQDACAAVSNFIESYNITEYYTNWRIFMDATAGPKLHMFQFDGAPLAPQFQISTTPNMLPPQLLRNVSRPTTDGKTKAAAFLKSNSALETRSWTTGVIGTGMAALVFASFVI
jgi:hypothetical protein